MSTASALRVVVSASIAPSESRERVLEAAKNVLGECRYEVEETESEVTLTSSDAGCMRRIHDQLRDRRVRDAARRLLLRRREGNRLSLLLNRQAATVGTVALCSSEAESPLGPVYVLLDCADADAVIEWLTAH